MFITDELIAAEGRLRRDRQEEVCMGYEVDETLEAI
jgi:hypothetical protein